MSLACWSDVFIYNLLKLHIVVGCMLTWRWNSKPLYYLLALTWKITIISHRFLAFKVPWQWKTVKILDCASSSDKFASCSVLACIDKCTCMMDLKIDGGPNSHGLINEDCKWSVDKFLSNVDVYQWKNHIFESLESVKRGWGRRNETLLL